MGKKSKRRECKGTPTVVPSGGAIPRQRHLHPTDWEENMATLHPTKRPGFPYIAVDFEVLIDKQTNGRLSLNNRPTTIEHYSDCPICFQDATQTCSKCGTVTYCGRDHQIQHWKQSHKRACKPNPKPHNFELSLTMLEGLSEDCFEGHEFLVIRPTEKLGSLQEICDQVLESADDLLDMPGFGNNQLDINWLNNNAEDPLYQQIVQKFGWTSGRMSLEQFCGYRMAEARIVYFCWFDDNFQSEMDQAPSYYGRAAFQRLAEGKHVRGNLVIYKLMLKKKRRVPPDTGNAFAFLLAMTDDADLHYEYVLQPINKAEIALMLSERCKAMDNGAFTTRQWRHVIRQAEIQIEAQGDNVQRYNLG